MKDVNILIKNGIDIKQGLENFGSMDIYDDTLDTFLEEATTKINDLEKYLLEKNMNAYATLAHSLKSDARYFGMIKLAKMAFAHEMAGKDNNIEEVTTGFKELKEECNLMIKVAKEYLNSDKQGMKTILIADDSEIIRSFVKKVLENDFIVVTAKDGEETLNALKNNQEICAVLLDLNMPQIDGFAVLNYMKENNLFDKIHVSILTGNEILETDKKAFEYPIVDMLKKPFDEEKLKNMIDKTINLKQAV